MDQEQKDSAHWAAALFVAQVEVWPLFEQMMRDTHAVQGTPFNEELTRESMIQSLDMKPQEFELFWSIICEHRRPNRRNAGLRPGWSGVDDTGRLRKD